MREELILETIKQMVVKNKNNKVEPSDIVPYIDVKREFDMMLKNGLNELFKSGKIKTCRMINGTGIILCE